MNDNYMGSGKLIKKAIKKYGVSNFKKTILEECSSFEELLSKEAEIVNIAFVERADTYNLSLGGRAPDARLISEYHKGSIIITDGTSMKKIPENYPIPPGWSRGWLGSGGNLNKVYITDGVKTKRVLPGDLPDGWRLGRGSELLACAHFSITNGVDTKRVSEYDPIPSGWWRGREVKPCKDTKWITDGVTDKLISSSDNLPDGWRRGRSNLEKDFKIITNGVTNKKWNGEPLLDGWYFGSRPIAGRASFKGKIWITDGVNSKAHPAAEDIPAGWVKGRKLSQPVSE